MTLGIAGVTLAAYLRSLLPGIGFSGDSAKWSYLSELGGVPHETGYPLYMALIQAFGAVVPFGSPAWRTNLLSALFATAAVCVLYRLLLILGVRRAVAGATALTFAVTLTFWSQAVVAEVYTLHILLMASITACLARWRTGGANAWLLAGIALLALAFGNHMTTVFAVPGVAWLVWSDRARALTRRNVGWAGLCAALGAAQYLYLIYMTRVGGFVEVPVHDVADIGDMVRGGQFQDRMFPFSLGELLTDRVPMLWRFLWEDSSLLVVPAAYGAWRGLRLRREDPARWAVVASLVLLGVGTTIYGLNYDVSDIRVFFLPLFLVLAVFLGLGLDGIAAAVEARLAPDRRWAWVIAGAAFAIPAALALVDYPKASQRGDREAPPRAEQIIAAAGEHAVILTWNYNDSEFLRYTLFIEDHGEPDLAVASEVSPEHILAYLDSGVGPVAVAAEGLDGTDPPGLFTPSRHHMTALSRAGVQLTEVAPEVWRIDQQ